MFMSFQICRLKLRKALEIKIRSLNTTFRSNKSAPPQLHWLQHNQICYPANSLNSINPNLFIMRVDIIKVCSRISFNGGYCQKATRLHDSKPKFFRPKIQNTLFMYKWDVRSYKTKNFHKNWRLNIFQCKKQN